MSLEYLTAFKMTKEYLELLTAIQMTKDVIIATDSNPDDQGYH